MRVMKQPVLCAVVLTENCVGGVQSGQVYDRLAGKHLVVGERDAGRREAVALVIGDNLAAISPPYGHT